MANIFNMAEIVDLGIEKEKRRRDFYGAVAARTDDEELKELFGRLRDWEEEHIRIFSGIRAELDEHETVESYPGEQRDYMEALIDDQLYRDVSPEEMADLTGSPREAIERGITFEKDAILFFRSLGAFLSSPQREVIERLVREEQTHLVYLTRLRARYRG